MGGLADTARCQIHGHSFGYLSPHAACCDTTIDHEAQPNPSSPSHCLDQSDGRRRRNEAVCKLISSASNTRVATSQSHPPDDRFRSQDTHTSNGATRAARWQNTKHTRNDYEPQLPVHSVTAMQRATPRASNARATTGAGVSSTGPSSVEPWL